MDNGPDLVLSLGLEADDEPSVVRGAVGAQPDRLAAGSYIPVLVRTRIKQVLDSVFNIVFEEEVHVEFVVRFLERKGAGRWAATTGQPETYQNED